MKRKLTLIFVSIIVLMGVIYFIHPFYIGYSNSALEASQRARGKGYINKVTHQETVDGGIILFYYHGDINTNPIFGADYVKHNIFGWKWVNGGMHSYSKLNDYNTTYGLEYSLTNHYFPITTSSEIGSFPYPMLMGEINNSRIEKIVVEDTVKGLKQEAKVVTIAPKIRIWFSFLKKDSSKEIELSGLDEKGDLVVKKAADTQISKQGFSSGTSTNK